MTDGDNAWDPKSAEYNVWFAYTQELTRLLHRKHQDYGPGNIMSSGFLGLIVRLGDKIARLQNLMKDAKLGDTDISYADPQFESIADTFADISGYGIIGQMLLNKDFPPEDVVQEPDTEPVK